jgi:Family of unknown function (DUF6496)
MLRDLMSQRRSSMPEEATKRRARRDARQGKSASTQAGEFVREEIHHVREGEHGARSAKQVIAIGLSKARRAGVKLPPRPGSDPASSGSRPKKMRKSAARARAALSALKDEPLTSASHLALSRQAHKSAAKRGPRRRGESAQKAARTRTRAGKLPSSRAPAE